MKLPAILSLCAVTSCSGKDEAPPEPMLRSVRYTVVEGADASRKRTFSGVIRAGDQSSLSFQVPGRVDAVGVKVGDKVKKGQLIASLDPADARLALQQAQATLAQIKAQARSAQAGYERVRRLYTNRNASQQDLDNARAQNDGAQSQVAAATQAVMQARRQKEYCKLTAPDAGTIRSLSVEKNEIVGPGQPVAELQLGEHLEVALDVPEVYINDVRREDAVTITVTAANTTTLTGTVFEVGIPLAGGGSFPVSVRLAAGAAGVRSGMAAEVTFELEHEQEEGPQAIRIPLTAVGEDRNGRFVFIIEDEKEQTGKVARHTVTVGTIEGDRLQILSGLDAGAKVVTAGVSRIQDGLRVRVPAEPVEF
jgi:multidrug efflux system membrane fusion protein